MVSPAKSIVNENGKRLRDSDESEGKQTKVSTKTNENDQHPGDQRNGKESRTNQNDREVKVEEQSSKANSNNVDLNAKYDLALKKSCQTLLGLGKMLSDNKRDPDDGGTSWFCSNARYEGWQREIKEQLLIGKAGPKTVVGVLGATGVGKSSMLNALLDEAAVLPTSGSRGCTAAVVELTYNTDLLQDPMGRERTPSINTMPPKKVPVYKGKIEFMTLEDWATELKLLVNECSTPQELVLARCPEEHTHPDTAAAWAKIDQVYGKGTMAGFSGNPKESVIQALSTNTRVVNLLTPKPDSQDPYNAVYVEEGSIDLSEAAKTVLCKYNEMGAKAKNSLKRWARSFRSKINDYLYRKGNGHEAQTWPLIRCVSLQGPWNVLSSGGVLVDLPGVRDANTARARVSERYLQNCNQIWVVAPIKRAVDDGTAKELMGERFKRRLLMDGQYGNVTFICTQTDDCEATEIMRDHEDIAVHVSGRWEKMTELREEINAFETKLSDLQQQEEDLKVTLREAKELLKQALKDATNPTGEEQSVDDDDCDIEESEEESLSDDDDAERREVPPKDVDEDKQQLDDQLTDEKKAVQNAEHALSLWRKSHNKQKTLFTKSCSKLQKKLKAICAKVRNEYSTKCLEDDFITGLKEMYEDANETLADETKERATPKDVSLPVFCISANDYLKLTAIKSSSDGRPNCFFSAKDTQIERLREHVYATTALRRDTFAKTFVNRTSDIVNRVMLLAHYSKSNGGSTKEKVQCKDLFDNKMKALSTNVVPIARDFETKAMEKIRQTLKPALTSGAEKALLSAMPTIHSWGSTNRRTKNERSAEQNGLHWNTYHATARHNGSYFSPNAGHVDFNAELLAPMEAEFSAAWQSAIDGAFVSNLSESKRRVIGLCREVDKSLLNEVYSIGIEKARVTRMVSVSSSNCENTMLRCFEDMRLWITEKQRELNRSLLPKVQQSMQQSYAATTSVPNGKGKFDRMKKALHDNSRVALNRVFYQCKDELLEAIEYMVKSCGEKIVFLTEFIELSLSSVYSILWEHQVDHDRQQKVLACRAACLAILNRLQKQQDEAMKVLGIERPNVELVITRGANQNGENSMNDLKAGERAMGNIGHPLVKQEPGSNFATLNLVKEETALSMTLVREGAMKQTIDSNDIDDFHVNENLDCLLVSVYTKNPRLSVEKLSQGFFVTVVKRHTHFTNGSILPGDIITKIDGKPASVMDLRQFKNITDSGKDSLSMSIMRSAITAKAGPLGLFLNKADQGYLITRISEKSQLRGRVEVGDILTTIDGTLLSKVEREYFVEADEVRNSSKRPVRHLWILRKNSMQTALC